MNRNGEMCDTGFVYIAWISVVLGLLVCFDMVQADLGECPSYCDHSNNLHPGFACQSEPNLYCCGNQTFRYCCSDISADISNTYYPICVCPYYECIYTGWQAMFAVLVLILFAVILALCCCNLFAKFRCFCKKRETSGRDDRRSQISEAPEATEVIESTGTVVNNGIFNPTHQFAFSPPDYETLDKDLPKYEEIFVTPGNNLATAQQSEGHANLAFVAEDAEVEYAQVSQEYQVNQRQQHQPQEQISHNEQQSGQQQQQQRHINEQVLSVEYLQRQSEECMQVQLQEQQQQQQQHRQQQIQLQQQQRQHQQQQQQQEQRQLQQQPQVDGQEYQNVNSTGTGRVILVIERSDSDLGPPDNSPPGTPPPPYDH